MFINNFYDILNLALIWGVSAVGSARHWQCRGQGFESPTLQIKEDSKVKGVFLLEKFGCFLALRYMRYFVLN